MFLRDISEESEFLEVNAAPRAIVCLNVPWSGYPHIAQSHLSQALARLGDLEPSIEAFVADEEAEACLKWLKALTLATPLDGRVPIGSGALIWLEFGRVRHCIIRGSDLRPIGIIETTKELWAALD